MEGEKKNDLSYASRAVGPTPSWYAIFAATIYVMVCVLAGSVGGFLSGLWLASSLSVTQDSLKLLWIPIVLGGGGAGIVAYLMRHSWDFHRICAVIGVVAIGWGTWRSIAMGRLADAAAGKGPFSGLAEGLMSMYFLCWAVWGILTLVAGIFGMIAAHLANCPDARD